MDDQGGSAVFGPKTVFECEALSVTAFHVIGSEPTLMAFSKEKCQDILKKVLALLE